MHSARPPTQGSSALLMKRHQRSSRVNPQSTIAQLPIIPNILDGLAHIVVALPVGLPGVLWVLPDSYIDVKNKDYGGQFNTKNI